LRASEPWGALATPSSDRCQAGTLACLTPGHLGKNCGRKWCPPGAPATASSLIRLPSKATGNQWHAVPAGTKPAESVPSAAPIQHDSVFTWGLSVVPSRPSSDPACAHPCTVPGNSEAGDRPETDGGPPGTNPWAGFRTLGCSSVQRNKAAGLSRRTSSRSARTQLMIHNFRYTPTALPRICTVCCFRFTASGGKLLTFPMLNFREHSWTVPVHAS
jgi:hypothetical protein